MIRLNMNGDGTRGWGAAPGSGQARLTAAVCAARWIWTVYAAMVIAPAFAAPAEASLPGNGPVASVTLNKAALDLGVGETNRLEAIVRGTTNRVLWASSNPGFARVGPDGLITAVHEGSLMITASLPGHAAVAECRVTVVERRTEPPPLDAPLAFTGIVLGNEIREMVVGDDLGVVAYCLPYRVFESNPYVLETSNSNILQVSRANIVTAVGAGMVTLTARTPDGHTDSITFEVKPPPPDDLLPPEATYPVQVERFGIRMDNDDPEQARRNAIGVNQVLLYAQRWGYRNVVFPRGRYLLDPAEPISMRSNLRIDLNGSVWQIMPNAYPRYALIRFREMNGINLFKGYDIAATPAERPSLSVRPLASFAVNEGETSILSLPIPVGPHPAKVAQDQMIRALEREALCFVSSPIGVERTTLDANQPAKMEVRLRLNYFSQAALVASDDLGAIWLRDTTGKLWCDRATTWKLRPEADYDSIRLELAFSLKNCRAEILTDRPVVSRQIAAVLENCKLCNGTILGERDFKEALYPKWQSDGATEGALAISFEEGRNNGIENLTVRKSIGFNMASRLGAQSSGAVGVGAIPLKFADLEWGDLDEQGDVRESATVQRTLSFLNLAPIKDTFELGLPLGYMGYNILRVRVYDIFFYDAGKDFLGRRRGCQTYRKYAKPEGAAWAKVVLHWESPITAGHTDFAGAIGFLTEYKPPIRNYIRNCVIEDNYSCGFAACGGINWRIEGNIFRRNGGRMPGCDIDWEDGWEYSQDDVVRSNSFESASGVIVCAGVNHVFKGNTFKGNLTAYGRSQAMKYEGNTFGAEGKTNRVSFGTQTDAFIVGNRFINSVVKFDKEHRDKAKYEFIRHDNQ